MEALYQPGDLIRDKYRIVGILGEGGTAITYEAVDITESDLSVAIKVLSFVQTKDWKLVELFEREARVLKNLHHSRIPKYLDYFAIDTDKDRQFLLVQELIPGKSLGDLVTQGWYFQESEVKNIAQQILEILTYLHGFQPPVIHRDIKPHNIIRTEAGKIYLVDLGAVQDVYRNTLTRGATFVGTIDYMSPEQLRGHASFASDLYSLGCTLLYLLTKRSPSELPLQRMKIDFRSSLKISEQFANWLDTLLEPALEDRFASTPEALDRLNSKICSTIQAPSGSNIIVQKTSNSLIFHIPPNKNIDILKCLIYFAIMSGLTLMYFLYRSGLKDFQDFQNVQFFLTLHSIIWTGFFGYQIICPLILRTKIILKRERFLIYRDYKILQKREIGDTKNISRVAIDQKINYKTKRVTGEYCSIEAGTKRYKFCQRLSLPEKRWLVEEIRNFAMEMNPYKMFN